MWVRRVFLVLLILCKIRLLKLLRLLILSYSLRLPSVIFIMFSVIRVFILCCMVWRLRCGICLVMVIKAPRRSLLLLSLLRSMVRFWFRRLRVGMRRRVFLLLLVLRILFILLIM